MSNPLHLVTHGNHCRIIGEKISIGSNVVLGDHVTLAGDSITIGDNVRIGSHSDVRAAEIYIGDGSEIAGSTNILAADSFRTGKASRISRHASITCRSFHTGDFFYAADHFSVGYGGTTESTANVVIGNRVALGPHNIVNANHEIHLADKVGSGSYVTFWTHGFHFGHSILEGYAPAFQPIRIGQNVWLGYHVTLLPGITIGKNSIVAAGAMVASAQPADHLVGGVPAKPIRQLAPKKATPEAAQQILTDLLQKWADELVFKGLETAPVHLQEAAIAGVQAKQTDDTTATAIYLLGTDTSSIKNFPEERTIFITVSGGENLAAELGTEQTLFRIEAEELHGYSSALSEDLRDFLRRHTLPCGFDSCYRSIEPASFTRLKNLT